MPRYIDISEKEVIEMYNSNNFKMCEICAHFNVSKFKIRKVLLKNNVISKSAKKYTYFDDIFENIDNEEKAYWLGFLYADGYVRERKGTGSELKLKLAVNDKSHLDKFSRFISTDDLPIVYEEYKNSKSFRISVNSKKIVHDLITHGCVNKKSLIIQFPKLNSDLIQHFIRGYFDGDGCICIRTNNTIDFTIVSGSMSMLTTLVEYLSVYSHIPMQKIHKFKKSNLYRFSYTIKYDVKKIYNYLYEYSNIYLDRKKLKFDLIK